MSTIIVNPGDDLQAAINSAVRGDIIQIDKTGTWTDNYTIPDYGAGTSYVTLITSGTLPASGTRVAPGDASEMPEISAPVGGAPVFQIAIGAHHVAFRGLNLPGNPGGFGEIVSIGYGDNTQSTLADVPYNITIDQCYIHGTVPDGQKRGIGLNGANLTITNNYISNCWRVGQDAQALAGWNGPGPWLIDNNFLEASGENFQAGGTDASITGLVPSGITFTNNLVSKPSSWRGLGYVVKNLFELKNANDCDIHDNVFQYNWAGEGQSGYAIVFTPRNSEGGNPWTVVQNVEFYNNIIRHSSSGINILGRDSEFTSQLTNNINVHHNLFDDISGANWGDDGWFLQIGGGADTVTINHNTCIHDGSKCISASSGDPMTDFVFINNIVFDHLYGILGDDSAPGNVTIAQYFPGSTFARNIIIGAPSSDYPTNNFYPAHIADVGFTDFVGGDYSLSVLSPYRLQGTDAQDPGWFTLTPVPPETAPETPTGPTPANSATGIATSVTLMWSAPGATTYDLKFDTVNPPVAVEASGLAVASYLKTGLSHSTVYYWRILATNTGGTTTGPVWSFTTSPVITPNPPDTPASPTPTNAAVDRALDLALSWVADGATSYAVKLDTVTPPVTTVASGLLVPTYTAADLDAATTYYWRITATNGDGSTVGPIWSFDTLEGPFCAFLECNEQREAIRFVRRFNIQSQAQYREFISRIEFYGERGVGVITGQGSNPLALVRFSKDGGVTWGVPYPLTMGKIGEFPARMFKPVRGMARNWCVEVAVTDPVIVALMACYVDIEPGTN